MIEIKEEPYEVEVRYREAESESESSENYHQYESIRDQVQAAWCIDDLEVKPKIERIEFDPNRQPVIRLDSDFLRLNFRSKWIELVTSTFRRPHMKKACQLCEKIIEFDSASKLVEHYADFHRKEITSYQCTLCEFSGRQTKELFDHWAEKHKRHHKSIIKNKYTETKKTNDRNNTWIGDDELVHSFFVSKQQSGKKRSKKSEQNFFECVRIGHQRSNYTQKQEIMAHKIDLVGGKFECDYCLKTYTRKGPLSIHMNSHINNTSINRTKSFECKFCSKRFSTNGILKTHEFKMHLKGTLPKDDPREIRDAYDQEIIKCDICSRKLKRFNMREHKKLFHKDTNEFECDICGGKYRIKSELKRHILLKHAKRKSFPCVHCTRTFIARTAFRKHEKEIHQIVQPKLFECDYCHMIFGHRSNLAKHMKFHVENKLFSAPFNKGPFKCEHCSKAFSTKICMKQHEYIHLRDILPKDDPRIKSRCLKESLVECEICLKTMRKAYLSVHKRIHETKREFFKCNVCDIKVLTERSLKKHMNTHMEMSMRKKFDCKFCSKQFLSAGAFREHEQSHNRDPFECDICGNKYEYLHSLKKHILNTHSIKVKRFKCTFCSQLLKSKSSLIRHEMKHRKGYIFKCQYCNFKTMDKSNLYAHIRSVHFDLLRQQDKLDGGLNDLFQGIRTFECYKCKHSSLRKDHTEIHLEKCEIGSKFLNCPNCIQKFGSEKKLQLHMTKKH